MVANTVAIELSRKELLELKNKLSPTSKLAQKIMNALDENIPSEDDEEILEEGEGIGRFDLRKDYEW